MKLSRGEQRYNYLLAIGAVAVVVVLVVVSPTVTLDGQPVPVLVFALLVGAFIFGLGQMLVGITRRRRYLRSLEGRESGATDR
ncbi:MAG: hypothetical protein QOE92_901 [Chloroflexota bacterium]|nr:hypothetical protein [Chloroflexota bacterium]